MLLQTTAGGGYEMMGAHGGGGGQLTEIGTGHGRRPGAEGFVHEGQGTPYQYRPAESRYKPRGRPGQGQGGGEMEFQAHIFTPPVTGPPPTQKKAKYVNLIVGGEFDCSSC